MTVYKAPKHVRHTRAPNEIRTVACLSVRRVPRPNSTMEMHRKPKIGRMEGSP